MKNFVEKIERFFINAEAFFSNLNFVPRLLNAFKSGMTAFNDSFFAHDKKRQLEIEERNKPKDAQ